MQVFLISLHSQASGRCQIVSKVFMKNLRNQFVLIIDCRVTLILLTTEEEQQLSR